MRELEILLFHGIDSLLKPSFCVQNGDWHVHFVFLSRFLEGSQCTVRLSWHFTYTYGTLKLRFVL